MGLLIPGFTLTWTVAKEVNRPEHSGIATSVVNVGIFLGTGILQPLVGWVLDRGRAAGDVAGAWDSGIACSRRRRVRCADDVLRAGNSGRGAANGCSTSRTFPGKPCA